MVDLLRGQDGGRKGRHHRDGLGAGGLSLEGADLELGSAAPARIRVERPSRRGDASRAECHLPLRIDSAGKLYATDGHLSTDYQTDRPGILAGDPRLPRPARSAARRQAPPRVEESIRRASRPVSRMDEVIPCAPCSKATCSTPSHIRRGGRSWWRCARERSRRESWPNRSAFRSRPFRSTSRFSRTPISSPSAAKGGGGSTSSAPAP